MLTGTEDTTDQEAGMSESQRMRRIHSRVCRVRTNEEIRVKYTQAWEEKYYDREEGWNDHLNQRIQKRLAKGKGLSHKPLLRSFDATAPLPFQQVNISKILPVS